MDIYNSFVCNCQNLEAMKIFFSGGMDKSTMLILENETTFQCYKEISFQGMKRHGISLNAYY